MKREVDVGIVVHHTTIYTLEEFTEKGARLKSKTVGKGALQEVTNKAARTKLELGSGDSAKMGVDNTEETEIIVDWSRPVSRSRGKSRNHMSMILVQNGKSTEMKVTNILEITLTPE